MYDQTQSNLADAYELGPPDMHRLEPPRAIQWSSSFTSSDEDDKENMAPTGPSSATIERPPTPTPAEQTMAMITPTRPRSLTLGEPLRSLPLTMTPIAWRGSPVAKPTSSQAR